MSLLWDTRHKWVNQSFFHKNDNRHFQCVVLGFADTDFVQGLSDAPHKSFDVDVTRMLDDLIDNKFVKFAGWIFQQTSAFLFELIVLHCLPTCFYTRLRQSLYRVS